MDNRLEFKSVLEGDFDARPRILNELKESDHLYNQDLAQKAKVKFPLVC